MRGQAREASRRSNEGIKLENLAIFLALSTVRGTSMGQGVLEKKMPAMPAFEGTRGGRRAQGV
jgi:hypothetical protein